jgi:hypothetical protein
VDTDGVDLDRDLESIEGARVLAPGYRRRKLVGYVIRTALAVGFYWLLWDHAWVRWTLAVYVPLNVGGLIFILFVPRMLRRKVRADGHNRSERGNTEHRTT